MSTTQSSQYRIINRDGSLNTRRSQRPGKLDFRDLYHGLLGLSWPAFAAWFALIFFLANAVFWLLYFWIPAEQFSGLRHLEGFERFLDLFFFSVQTLGTIGYGGISPVGVLANTVVTIECYTGLFIVAVMTGLIFSRFARPHSKVSFTRNAVIRKFGEVPCLMFRIANERLNHITDARVGLHLVIDDPATGYRDFVLLKLEREHSPIFALSWTVAHDIDASSPLFGLSLDEIRKRSGEIIVSFSGVDTTLSQTVYAKTSYIADDILLDHDFEDVIERTQQGFVLLHLERFDRVRKVGSDSNSDMTGV